MRTTLFLTALAAMASSVTEAVPIAAATEAEFLGLHKLFTPTYTYCLEKLGQAEKELRDFYQGLLSTERAKQDTWNENESEKYASLMKNVAAEIVATKR